MEGAELAPPHLKGIALDNRPPLAIYGRHNLHGVLVTALGDLGEGLDDLVEGVRLVVVQNGAVLRPIQLPLGAGVQALQTGVRLDLQIVDAEGQDGPKADLGPLQHGIRDDLALQRVFPICLKDKEGFLVNILKRDHKELPTRCS